MSKSLASVAVVSALVTSASAQNMVAVDAMPPAPERPGLHLVDSRLGMLLGGADVGDVDGFSIGISGGLGYRIGDVTLRGLFDYYKVGDSSDEMMQRRGRAMRVGGAARYSFANNGDDGNVGIDFWGELGGGYEHVDWRTGGVLGRPSAEIAFGFDVGGRGRMDRATGHRREVGYFMAFRSLVGQAPLVPSAKPTCGGPCDMATVPSRTDVSMFFELGLHWGR
jgi:hypothetical protein